MAFSGLCNLTELQFIDAVIDCIQEINNIRSSLLNMRNLMEKVKILTLKHPLFYGYSRKISLWLSEFEIRFLFDLQQKIISNTDNISEDILVFGYNFYHDITNAKSLPNVINMYDVMRSYYIVSDGNYTEKQYKIYQMFIEFIDNYSCVSVAPEDEIISELTRLNSIGLNLTANRTNKFLN